MTLKQIMQCSSVRGEKNCRTIAMRQQVCTLEYFTNVRHHFSVSLENKDMLHLSQPGVMKQVLKLCK